MNRPAAQLELFNVGCKEFDVINSVIDVCCRCAVRSAFRIALVTFHAILLSNPLSVLFEVFMSPELLKQCKPYDAFKSDAWALGVLLVMMLSGPQSYVAAAPAARAISTTFKAGA